MRMIVKEGWVIIGVDTKEGWVMRWSFVRVSTVFSFYLF